MKLTLRNTKGAKQPHGWTASSGARKVGTSGENYTNKDDAIHGAELCAQTILADPRTDDKAIIARHLRQFGLIVVPVHANPDSVQLANDINAAINTIE